MPLCCISSLFVAALRRLAWSKEAVGKDSHPSWTHESAGQVITDVFTTASATPGLVLVAVVLDHLSFGSSFDHWHLHAVARSQRESERPA